MRRLFAFGCSFTNYAWPSYADFLSYEFDKYENWGFPGFGNRAIAERVAECHAKNNFTKDDTILVQWTSHTRNDFHTFKEIEYSKDKFIHGWFRPTNKIGWKTQGNIFGSGNLEINYDPKWLNNFWDEYSYFMYSMNEILLTQGLLDSTNCKWRMITISDMAKLGSDTPATAGEQIRTLDENAWEEKAKKIPDESFHVIVDTPTFFDGVDDGGEIIIRQVIQPRGSKVDIMGCFHGFDFPFLDDFGTVYTTRNGTFEINL